MSEIIGRGLVRHRVTPRQKKAVEIIHRKTCRIVRGKPMLPWSWAEDRPVSEWVNLPWFKPCSVCCPELGTVPEDIETLSKAALTPVKEPGA